ncbi:MAG: aminoacyl-tRNA hydrolase [Clostridia bacterium]|nr:aminoacyl-tRNA hydrolase [Clostridia bacterium]
MFKKKINVIPEWIVVGLGNPGAQYRHTRHNAGFVCVDALADDLGIKINTVAFDSLTALCSIDGVGCLVMKPQTFMNASGTAVVKAAKKYNIPHDRILVVTDDVCFNVGSVRIRKEGSSGGQKGVNDIIVKLGTQEFPRIKVGAGKKPEGTDMVDWVLGNFSFDEQNTLKDTAKSVVAAIKLIVNGDIELAISRHNKTK